MAQLVRLGGSKGLIGGFEKFIGGFEGFEGFIGGFMRRYMLIINVVKAVPVCQCAALI